LAVRVRARLNLSEGRSFGFTVGIAFLVFAGVFLWRDHRLPGIVSAVSGGVLILMGFFAPHALGPVKRVWMRLAHLISKVTTPVFMGIVYLTVVTPTGLIMRMIGKNPLRKSGRERSWWRETDGVGRPEDMRRQF